MAGLLAALVLVMAAPSAHASVTGYNEPAFTKTSGNNTYWWFWQRIAGVADDQNPDSNHNGVNDANEYYICFSTDRNGIAIESHQGSNGPGSQNCTGYFTPTTQQSGNYGAYPLQSNTVLDDGATYSMCATDYRRYVFIWSYGTVSCPSTTIDRNKPTVGVDVNGTAQYTNNPVLNFHTVYTDATSGPWPATYRCIKVGSPCTGSDSFQYDANCSVPAGNGFNFYCEGDASGQGDGPIYFCAAAADRGVPDNPNGTNQFVYGSGPNAGQGVTSDTANISDFQCGYVILDRTPPGVTAGASATTVKVGDLVNFSASATDATSGLSNSYSWNFGDNTAGANGSNVSHTYTTAGTFVAKATTSDGAGNSGEGTKTITVTPASTSGGGGGGGGPVTGGTSSGGTLTPPPTTKEISAMTGGGGTSTTSIGALDIIAPKRFTITGKRQKLPLVLSPDTAGKVTVALVSPARTAAAAKIVAKASANFTEPGSYGLNMKLPRKLKAGTYRLKVTFKAAGSTRALTKTLKVKFVKKRARRSAARPANASKRPKVTGGPGYGVKPKRSHRFVIR